MPPKKVNWLQRTAQGNDLFSGNCGMYAIALGKKAQEAGKNVVMVVCSNEDSLDELLDGEPTVYHIAAEIDGIMYDGSGKTTLQKLGEFSAATYGDHQPKCSFIALDDVFIRFVRTQTDWSVGWEEYYKQLAG